MPRDGSNIYSQPFPDVVEDTTIESTVYNGFTNDVAADLNAPRPIVAGGTGATSADQALFNLGGEKAAQLVTNYDSHLWIPGSFRSAAAATGAPNGTAAFAGVVYINEALANPPTNSNVIVEARDLTSGTRYTRRKTADTWGAWVTQAGSTTELDAAYVNVTGDTMTGNLAISNASTWPTLTLNRTVDTNGCSIIGSSINLMRWQINMPAAGAAAPLQLFRYDDSGVTSAQAMEISRSDASMTYYGDISMSKVNPALILAKTASAQASLIGGNTGTSPRWRMALGTSEVESSGNLGSNFAIYRYNDAGSIIDSPFSIARATAAVTMAGNISVLAPAAGDPLITLRNAAGSVVQSYFFSTLADGDAHWTGLAGAWRITITPGGSVTLGAGFRSRPGTAGTLGVASHNFNWTGSVLQAWVDITNLGTVSFVSDYRIKKDVIDLPGMWDTVKALRPIKYTQAQYTPQIEIERRLKEEAAKRERDAEVRAQGVEPKPAEPLQPMFIADNVERWGFVAHELQETLTPSAATGEKDSADTVQSPNPWTVIATLTKALQEAMTRIEALEAR